MEINVKRYIFGKDFTQGRLYIDNEYFCETIEPKDCLINKDCSINDIKDLKKEFGKIAIPVGKYLITLTYSNRFKKILPLINNVPGFSGVRQHSGNSVKDSEGCQIIGENSGKSGWIVNSRITTDKLILKYKKAIEKKEKIYLKIEWEKNNIEI